MRKIHEKIKEQIATDPWYRFCARHDEGCKTNKITIDHALICAGQQIDELWNMVPLCEYHHAVNNFQDCGAYDKEL